MLTDIKKTFSPVLQVIFDVTNETGCLRCFVHSTDVCIIAGKHSKRSAQVDNQDEKNSTVVSWYI
jgi:hypothetical protein